MRADDTMKTTNFFNTSIEVADDCRDTTAEVPSQKGVEPTVAYIQYERLVSFPYKHTSDDVLFHVYAIKTKSLLRTLKQPGSSSFRRGNRAFGHHH